MDEIRVKNLEVFCHHGEIYPSSGTEVSDGKSV